MLDAEFKLRVPQHCVVHINNPSRRKMVPLSGTYMGDRYIGGKTFLVFRKDPDASKQSYRTMLLNCDFVVSITPDSSRAG